MPLQTKELGSDDAGKSSSISSSRREDRAGGWLGDKRRALSRLPTREKVEKKVDLYAEISFFFPFFFLVPPLKAVCDTD